MEILYFIKSYYKEIEGSNCNSDWYPKQVSISLLYQHYIVYFMKCRPIWEAGCFVFFLLPSSDDHFSWYFRNIAESSQKTAALTNWPNIQIITYFVLCVGYRFVVQVVRAVAMSYSNLPTMCCVKKFKRKKEEEDESALGLRGIGCCSILQNDQTLHTHVLSLLPLHQHP